MPSQATTQRTRPYPLLCVPAGRTQTAHHLDWHHSARMRWVLAAPAPRMYLLLIDPELNTLARTVQLEPSTANADKVPGFLAAIEHRDQVLAFRRSELLWVRTDRLLRV